MGARINRNPSKYDKYFVAQNTMGVRAPHYAGFWQCDKCSEHFRSFQSLRSHKKDFHSY